MKADREKMQIAMARACVNTRDLVVITGMPQPTVSKVITGKNVLPATLGAVAKALNVDPAEIVLSANTERKE